MSRLFSILITSVSLLIFSTQVGAKTLVKVKKVQGNEVHLVLARGAIAPMPGQILELGARSDSSLLQTSSSIDAKRNTFIGGLASIQSGTLSSATEAQSQRNMQISLLAGKNKVSYEFAGYINYSFFDAIGPNDSFQQSLGGYFDYNIQKNEPGVTNVLAVRLKLGLGTFDSSALSGAAATTDIALGTAYKWFLGERNTAITIEALYLMSQQAAPSNSSFNGFTLQAGLTEYF